MYRELSLRTLDDANVVLEMSVEEINSTRASCHLGNMRCYPITKLPYACTKMYPRTSKEAVTLHLIKNHAYLASTCTTPHLRSRTSRWAAMIHTKFNVEPGIATLG